jgi:hypothetical protein
MTDHITDKAVWSATKAWYLSVGGGTPWENLTDEQREAIRVEYVDHLARQPKSAHQLTAELRKARIDNRILQRKLAAAEARIRQFEASRELAAELAKDSEPSCP